MNYLQPTQYESYGLAPDTTDDWVTVASALMDSYCRRESLGVAQYTERIRLTRGSHELQLTYLPLAPTPPAANPLVAIKARYSHPRRGELASEMELLWGAFSLPGSWVTIDPGTVEWNPNGTVTLPWSFAGLPYNEVEVTYSAGLAVLPDAVMSACALIVKNAQSTSGMNVKSSKVDMLQVQYFSDQMVDSTVKTLLRAWIANRLG